MDHGRESVTESMVVEPDSTAGFKQGALVEMQETAMALVGKDKNELPTARTLYVYLDRADNVIEGGPPANPCDSLHLVQKENEPLNHCHTAFSAAAKRIPAFVSCS